MKALHMITLGLVVVGALNWLLVALAGKDIMGYAGFSGSSVATIVYVLIGLSGIYLAATHMKDCKMCSDKGMATM